MNELHEHRIKRLYMRSIRRGIKEMDIILTRFADARLAALPEDKLELYDAFLSENDQDLYQWVSGQMPGPEQYNALIAEIAEYGAFR